MTSLSAISAELEQEQREVESEVDLESILEIISESHTTSPIMNPRQGGLGEEADNYYMYYDEMESLPRPQRGTQDLLDALCGEDFRNFETEEKPAMSDLEQFIALSDYDNNQLEDQCKHQQLEWENPLPKEEKSLKLNVGLKAERESSVSTPIIVDQCLGLQNSYPGLSVSN